MPVTLFSKIFLIKKKYDERLSKLDSVLSRVDSLESSLKDEIKRRKTAERKVDDLKAKHIDNNFAERAVPPIDYTA